MSAQPLATSLVRNAKDAERRWFYGGGVHTWLARARDTSGAYLLCEMVMGAGKATPLHTHPADETLMVVEGELLVHLGGEEHSVSPGGIALAPAGLPHAFKVVSAQARVLCFHTPGTCEDFYFGASEPIDTATTTGEVDFGRIMASARENGGIAILGPPPFASADAH